MIYLLSFLVLVISLLLSIYLSQKVKSKKGKMAVLGAFSIVIILYGILTLLQMKEKRQESKATEYYRQLEEKNYLFGMGLPNSYVGGLGDNPLLKHSFKMGQKYRNEFKFKEAIEQYKECLFHPKSTPENKVAASNLIGICYFMLGKFSEAEKCYEQAILIAEEVKDEHEKLDGKAAAVGNKGIIYAIFGNTDKALESLEYASNIYEKIGGEYNKATIVCSIGSIYGNLGKVDDALECFRQSLEIFKKIGSEVGVASVTRLVGILY